MESQAETEATPVVRLSEGAAAEVKALLQKAENAGKTLRLYVEQGGCSGMQYSMVFDERRADDFVGEMHGVTVLVDPFSAQYLRGTLVDLSLTHEELGDLVVAARANVTRRLGQLEARGLVVVVPPHRFLLPTRAGADVRVADRGGRRMCG